MPNSFLPISGTTVCSNPIIAPTKALTRTRIRNCWIFWRKPSFISLAPLFSSLSLESNKVLFYLPYLDLSLVNGYSVSKRQLIENIFNCVMLVTRFALIRPNIILVYYVIKHITQIAEELAL